MTTDLQRLAQRRCQLCRRGTPPVPPEEVEQRLRDLPGWEPLDGHTRIRKSLRFRNFATALAYVNRLAAVAEEQDHHPDVEFGWGYAHLTWTTHNIGGLSDNDFIMAATSDLLFQDAPGRRE